MIHKYAWYIDRYHFYLFHHIGIVVDKVLITPNNDNMNKNIIFLSSNELISPVKIERRRLVVLPTHPPAS